MVSVADRLPLTMQEKETYLLYNMEELNRIGNKVRIGNLGITNDVFVPSMISFCAFACSLSSAERLHPVPRTTMQRAPRG